MEQAKALVDLGGYTVTLNIDQKKQAALEKAVKEKLTSKLDPEKRKVDADVQAGAVSVDPKTGSVVAMYGGVNYLKHYTNNATRDDYQPASTFKPVILAAAVDHDAETQDGVPITANTLYDGDSERPVMDGDQKVGFAPPNEDDRDYGEIDVQEAMNKSVNSVFAQMGIDVGMSEVMKVAAELGMDTEGEQAVPAQTLGSMGASPLEMAGVYATLDNHGKKVTPQIVKSVEHKDRTIEMPDPIGEEVISREAADTVTSVLTGVVDDGTARTSVRENPLRDGQQVAGKTGTSDNNKSAWFTGFTPGLVTSVGLFGEDDKAPHPQVPMYKAAGVDYRVNGGGPPAEIWAAYTFGVMDEVTKFDLDTKQGRRRQAQQVAVHLPVAEQLADPGGDDRGTAAVQGPDDRGTPVYRPDDRATARVADELAVEQPVHRTTTGRRRLHRTREPALPRLGPAAVARQASRVSSNHIRGRLREVLKIAAAYLPQALAQPAMTTLVRLMEESGLVERRGTRPTSGLRWCA